MNIEICTETPPPPPPTATKTYVFTLTEREAKLLYLLVGATIGHGPVRNELTTPIYNMLEEEFGDYYNLLIAEGRKIQGAHVE